MNAENELNRAERLKLATLLSCLEPLQTELRLPQLLALLQIALNPGLSVNELGERLHCPQQTASRHVAALLGRYQGAIVAVGAEGGTRSKLAPLVAQKISPSDPRSRALYLSESGVELLQEVLKKMNAKPLRG